MTRRTLPPAVGLFVTVALALGVNIDLTPAALVVAPLTGLAAYGMARLMCREEAP
jgi:hypothetical protein